MSNLNWNLPDAQDVRYWQALLNAINSLRERLNFSSLHGFPEGFHLKRADVDRIRDNLGYEWFLDPDRQVEYYDQTQDGPDWNQQSIYGTIPKWYRMLIQAGESWSTMATPWEYNLPLVMDYPHFFIKKRDGNLPANFSLFLKDAAGICRMMRYVPLSLLPSNGFKRVERDLNIIRWESDIGEMDVFLKDGIGSTETLTGFTTQTQVVQWMKTQWQNADSRYVRHVETEGLSLPGSLSGSFYFGGSSFRARCTFCEYNANGWPWDISLTMYCVNAPAEFHASGPYNAYDYAQPLSGTMLPKYPDTPGMEEYLYLQSTVSVIPVGNLNRDFRMGATWPFPDTLPQPGHSTGFSVQHPMFVADLTAAVIPLE